MSMPKPAGARPFPIPVVAELLGPGSQAEDDALDYLPMPRGMDTYRAPRLPEPDELAGRRGALRVMHDVLEGLDAALAAGTGAGGPSTGARVSLTGLGDADRRLLGQVLGEGEVSARVDDPAGPVRVQESVFAGVWCVVATRADGTLDDAIEVGAIPRALLDAARADALDDLDGDGAGADAIPPAPDGVMNSPSILVELRDLRRDRRPGVPAQVVNLTLLPLAPADLAHLDAGLGHGRVVILSRGYGNCRISNTRRADTWRVVYYNSADTMILNSIEVAAVPEVACAAPEDLRDSRERLADVLRWVEQAEAG